MRQRRLRKLLRRLGELREQAPKRDELLMKLGAARKEAGRAWHLVDVRKPKAGEEVSADTFAFALRRDRLRRARRREGRYLLRSNLTGETPETLWRHYMRLTEVEQAFKELKSDLAVRPVFHRLDARVEAHVFLAFVGYCLLVTLKNMARQQAPGLTPRAVIEKFAAIQMVDVHLPTSDGRELVLTRHTQPDDDHRLLRHRLVGVRRGVGSAGGAAVAPALVADAVHHVFDADEANARVPPAVQPSQRHLYAFDVSASAASLGVPAEQPLRTLSWHTPSTGSCPIAGWAAHSAQASSAPTAKPCVLTTPPMRVRHCSRSLVGHARACADSAGARCAFVPGGGGS